MLRRPKRVGTKLQRFSGGWWRDMLDDALFLAGCSIVCYGVSLIYWPAAFIVAGVCFIIMSAGENK